MAKKKPYVPWAETKAIKAFLGYLHNHYSKLIDPNDNNLILAVAAWFYQETGTAGLKAVIGNNPFNIRNSPLQSGSRKSKRKNGGHFAVFSTMARGWEAAAYLLMHGNKRYGYRLALNALKQGGNEGANAFLAALAMSSWDAAHYGAKDWVEAFDPKHNHLLRNYLRLTGGVQTQNPHPKPKPKPPELPRDFDYQVVVRNYLDPWAASDLYKRRNRRGTVDSTSLTR